EGVPKMIKMNSNEVLEALHEPLSGIVSAVTLALEQTPPELGADVAERGIVLTGGGGLLADLDKLISEENGLEVQVDVDPLMGAVRAGGGVLELVGMHGNGSVAPGCPAPYAPPRAGASVSNGGRCRHTPISAAPPSLIPVRDILRRSH